MQMIDKLVEVLIKQRLKGLRGEFEFLAVGQKATMARLWRIGLFGMRYNVGLFIERSE